MPSRSPAVNSGFTARPSGVSQGASGLSLMVALYDTLAGDLRRGDQVEEVAETASRAEQDQEGHHHGAQDRQAQLGRREVVEQVGGFSTDYFMYAEDMDLCVKVGRAGHLILYVPEAEIVHHDIGGKLLHSATDTVRTRLLSRAPPYLFEEIRAAVAAASGATERELSRVWDCRVLSRRESSVIFFNGAWLI